jgi:hypothetical protein
MFCREQAVQVHRARAELERRGARLAFVGNGAPGFARAFAEDHGITAPVLSDPSLVTYRALGMRRGLGATLLSSATWRHAARALRGGFRQGRVLGDAWQLGGVLVVRPGGEVAFLHRSGEAGDHPPVEDVLAALGPGEEAAGSRA